VQECVKLVYWQQVLITHLKTILIAKVKIIVAQSRSQLQLQLSTHRLSTQQQSKQILLAWILPHFQLPPQNLRNVVGMLAYGLALLVQSMRG
jgi:hypothetical protein